MFHHPPPTRAEPPPPASDRAQHAADGRPQRLKMGIAALGVVGAAMVAVPLVQMLAYQSDELQALAADRAALDPIGRTLSLQRGLVAHRELAAQVLDGRAAVEPQRRERQHDVGQQLLALDEALAAGAWGPALHEAASMQIDWLALAGHVTLRSIDAKASDASHRLLVEQSLQVMDLVADTAPPSPSVPARPQRSAGPAAATVAAQAHAAIAADGGRRSAAATGAVLLAIERSAAGHAAAIDERIAATRERRTRLLGGTAALGLLALAIAASLWRSTAARRSAPAPVSADASADATPPAVDAPREAAARLLHHLRQSPGASGETPRRRADDPGTRHDDAQPTMPSPL